MFQTKYRRVRTQSLQTDVEDGVDSKCLADIDLLLKVSGPNADYEGEPLHPWFYFIKAWTLALIICVAVCSSFVALAQSDHEATFGSLVKNFFELYQKKDIAGLMRLWSEKSPEAASSRQAFLQIFETNDKIEVKNFAISKTKVEGERATLRIVIEVSGIDAKTGKPAAEFGRQNRTFHLANEGGVWKIWQYVSSEEELAAALAEAKTEPERKALLEADRELVTVELQRSLTKQGGSLFDRGSYKQAMAINQLALQIAEQLDDKVGRATALNYIGIIHRSQGEYEQALGFYHQSLRIAQEIDDQKGITRTLNSIGIVHQSRGDYAQALNFYHRSLQIAEQLDDKAGVATEIYNIGTVHRLQGDYEQALDDYHKSLEIAEKINNKGLRAKALNGIGNVYQLQGNNARAMSSYQKSLEISEKIDDKASIASALNNMGIVHRSQGNYVQALDYYNRSLNFAEPLSNKANIANTYSNIGLVHRLQGNYAQALKDYDQSRQIREQIGDKAGLAIALNNIGFVHQSQGDYAQAMDCYYKSLEITEKINNKTSIASAYSNIAIVYGLQRNYPAAIHNAKRAAALANQIGYLEGFWEARATAGNAFYALGQINQARQAFTETISTIEDLRFQVAGGEQARQLFFEDKLLPYHKMIDLLVHENKPTEALAFAERAKGRVLLEVLESGKINITKTMSADEQQQERKLTSELVSLNTQLQRERLRQRPDQTQIKQLDEQLQQARLNYEQFHIKLYAAHPELEAQRAKMRPIRLAQAGGLIHGGGTALLEFVVTENKTYLFVLTKRRISPVLKVYTINVKQKDLADRIRLFHNRAQLEFNFPGQSRELFDLLLGQARAQLQNKSNLIIVPDGVLWELPFQALQPAPKRFLIQDSAISYAPSLTVLARMSRSRAITKATPPTLLAFGNPAIAGETVNTVNSLFMDEKLGPLPEAERMVKTLESLYGQTRSKVYVGEDAREERFKSEAVNYRILHLAAHGILNHESPMYSYIVLSQTPGSNAEDGLLEAWELMNMNLKADMIILSACETARGRIGNGEGMIGLSWAAFVAGTPTTVVSQWKVESKSTTELMLEFHRNLRLRKSKAEALRQAALKLLSSDDYRPPFYWAGFVIIGDGW